MLSPYRPAEMALPESTMNQTFLAALWMSATAKEATAPTIDEVNSKPVNGLTVFGVTFSYSRSGVSSFIAFHNTIGTYAPDF